MMLQHMPDEENPEGSWNQAGPSQNSAIQSQCSNGIVDLPAGTVLEANRSPRRVRDSTGDTITDRHSILGPDGRTYQGYMPGAYTLPNDGDEQSRLDLQHAMYLMMLDGKLAAFPMLSQPPRQVLDIGTGTGIWAIHFARENRMSHVTGTDLSAIQPECNISNIEFWVEDSEKAEWIFPQPFDFIHLRSLVACFDDIWRVIRKCYDHMTPGGWIEFQDPSWELQCIDATGAGSALEQLAQQVIIGGARAGRDFIKAKFYKDYLIQAGFRDVTEKIVAIPVGSWPRDDKQSTMGLYMYHAVVFAMDSYKQFLAAAGMAPAEIEDLVVRVKEEMQSERVHCWFPVYFVYGRKPYQWELEGPRSTQPLPSKPTLSSQ